MKFDDENKVVETVESAEKSADSNQPRTTESVELGASDKPAQPNAPRGRGRPRGAKNHQYAPRQNPIPQEQAFTEPTSRVIAESKEKEPVQNPYVSRAEQPVAKPEPVAVQQPQLQQQQAQQTSSVQQSQYQSQSNQQRSEQQQHHRNDHRQHEYRQYDRENRSEGRQHNQYQNQNQNQNQHSQQHASTPRQSVDEMSLMDLNVYARRLGVIGATLMNKENLLNRIKYVEAHPDMELEVIGVLEKLPDGFGFLRAASFDYVSGPDDVYVSPSQIRRFNLRTGDTVHGVIRKPKDGEKYFALLKINKVNFADPAATADRPNFDRLLPLHPDKKFNIEYDPTMISSRIMDLFAPIGKGQRGLIVAPPKVGKTMLLKEIAQAIIANHPECVLIVLLIDERPEEVTDMKRTVKGSSAEVISSTFDESAERHVQVAELVLEKAKRLVESGNDVVILLDAITRLARAYNTTAPASGKVLTGGIDANALQRPKRFFGAARNTEEGGSLTIIATALVDTGSRMDEVIYEEFKGTGNMEMHMTRKLSNRRIFPAFDLLASGTRRDDLLLSEEDLNRIWVLQKFLSNMNTIEGMEFMIDKIKKSKTNREFLESMAKKATNGSGSGSSSSGSSSQQS